MSLKKILLAIAIFSIFTVSHRVNTQAWTSWTVVDRISPVPEPTLCSLLQISIVGLVSIGVVRKIKQKKAVASS